jgi:hypothetical protein
MQTVSERIPPDRRRVDRALGAAIFVALAVAFFTFDNAPQPRFWTIPIYLALGTAGLALLWALAGPARAIVLTRPASASVFAVFALAAATILPLGHAKSYAWPQRFVAAFDGASLSQLSPLPLNRCVEVQRMVPERARVLPLTEVAELVTCSFVPFMRDATVVHHYQSPAALRFGEIALSDAAAAEAALRSAGVDYFYVSDQAYPMWAFSFSKLFEYDALRARLRVFAENGDRLVLTWRRSWDPPMAEATARRISEMRAQALTWHRRDYPSDTPFDTVVERYRKAR